MLTSFVTESLLTGLGAGGHMLVAGGGIEPTLLDFFVEAPTRLGDGSEVELQGVDVSFGDAEQVFHIGPASCGVYGTPAGVCEAARRWGTIALEDLAAPAAQLARDGVVLNAGQAYVAEILVDLLTSTPECAAIWAPGGQLLREGGVLRNPDLLDALLRLAGDGAEPFYRGDVADAVCAWLAERGGSLRSADLAGYEAIEIGRSSPTRRRPRAAHCSPMRSGCSIALPRPLRCRPWCRRWPPRSPSARRSFSRAWSRTASSSASSPVGSARPRTSR
jgi:gamma-glutamyltranspeptidase/glutathione hydrolase